MRMAVMGSGGLGGYFQNGVLEDQYLRATYDESHLMGGVGYVATAIDRPGVIRHTGPRQAVSSPAAQFGR